MSILILGGTADGRKLANDLHREGVAVIYSVAGLVRMPNVDCAVISGGFTQFGGLEKYIVANGVMAILDATHPYAQKMSNTAVSVAAQIGIACWRFHRPAWVAEKGDDWHNFDSWTHLHAWLSDYESVFLTCGQLTQCEVDCFKRYPQQVQLMRTAIQPKVHLLDSMSWIKAIGPFSLDDEIAIMCEHKIDALVSKNSGGSATSAKLVAARRAGVPVFMLARPDLFSPTVEFNSLAECICHVIDTYFNILVDKRADKNIQRKTNGF